MNTPRLTIPLLSALAAAVALTATTPEPAKAAYTPPRVYGVTAEGSGTFHYELSLPNGPETGYSVERDVSFAWNIKLPSVAFLSNGEGVPVNTAGGQAQGTITGDATEETTIVGDDGHGGHVTTHGYCEAKGASQPVGLALITPDPLTAGQNPGGANLTVSPFESIGFPADCTAAVYNGKATLEVEAEPQQFKQRFFLPTEATRQGKVIQFVQASAQQKDRCPSSVGLGDCLLDWHGTLTFEFTGYLGEDGELTPDDLPDLPAGGGAGQQPDDGELTPDDLPDLPAGGGAGQQPGDDDLIVPLPSRASLSANGDTASVEVKCATACSGVVRAFPAAGARTAAAKPLAMTRFRAPVAGKAVKVKLRFRGAARRKVRKARAVRLVVATTSAKRTLVVRARRPR